MGRSHLNLTSVIKVLLKIVILQNIREDTMGKSHLNVTIAVNIFQRDILLYITIKKSTGSLHLILTYVIKDMQKVSSCKTLESTNWGETI